MSRKEVVSEGLPRNWGKKFTSEGRPYYYNMLTDETVWDIKDISNEPEVEIMKRNSKKRYEINPDSDPLPPAITTTATTFTDPDGWSKLITQITSTVSLLSDSAQSAKNPDTFLKPPPLSNASASCSSPPPQKKTSRIAPNPHVVKKRKRWQRF
ncbi:hypothetical protein BC829DRAFT_302230 [Chytridium lagenaria]|nr:hypothetical protein BC829DRAFT_302230 [Chytridium lagenaria]